MENVEYMETLQKKFLELSDILGELVTILKMSDEIQETKEVEDRMESLMGRYFMKCLELEALKNK